MRADAAEGHTYKVRKVTRIETFPYWVASTGWSDKSEDAQTFSALGESPDKAVANLESGHPSITA